MLSFYPIFRDPDPEYGSRKLLNTDPIRIGIHNTAENWRLSHIEKIAKDPRAKPSATDVSVGMSRGRRRAQKLPSKWKSRTLAAG